MPKTMKAYRLSDLALSRLSDLSEWWSEDNQTTILTECVSQAWHREAYRRQANDDCPWIVQPGGRIFRSQDDAICWLQEKQSAVQVDAHNWTTYEDGVPETDWTLYPVRFTE
jgi:hypothetical protein